MSDLHAAEELARHPVQAGVGGGPDDALGPPGRGPGQQPQQRVGDDVARDAPVHSHVSLDVCGADSGVNLDMKIVSWIDLFRTTYRIDCDVVHPPLLGQVGRGQHVGQLGLVEGLARVILLVAV